MDKVMKAEIEKILEELAEKVDRGGSYWNAKDIDTTTSSITALIIKWLESKREKCKEGEQYWMWNSLHNVYEYGQMTGRNQLITELIGEVRC